MNTSHTYYPTVCFTVIRTVMETVSLDPTVVTIYNCNYLPPGITY